MFRKQSQSSNTHQTPSGSTFHPHCESLEERLALASNPDRYLNGVVQFHERALRQPESFVNQLYRDVLGRPADPAGLAHWSRLGSGDTPDAVLTHGLKSEPLARGFNRSLEHRTRVIDGLYQSYLGRSVEPAGLEAWLSFQEGSGLLEEIQTPEGTSFVQLGRGTTDKLKAHLLSSAEYFAGHAGGTADGFLRALYQDVLGRGIDPLGAAAFGKQLADGVSRYDVALAVLHSPEADQAVVEGFYQQYLHRSPGNPSMTYWVGQLQSGVDDQHLREAILNSEEYFLLG